jgi:hypothetical protein
MDVVGQLDWRTGIKRLENIEKWWARREGNQYKYIQ